MKVRKSFFLIFGVLAGIILNFKLISRQVYELKNKAEKFEEMFFLSQQWMRQRQKNKKSYDYLIKHGYKVIALYGLGFLGECFLDEIKESEVKVSYAIDREKVSSKVDVYRFNEAVKNVDAIIVTAITDFDQIKRNLEKMVQCPIISLKELIYN